MVVGSLGLESGKQKRKLMQPATWESPARTPARGDKLGPSSRGQGEGESGDEMNEQGERVGGVRKREFQVSGSCWSERKLRGVCFPPPPRGWEGLASLAGSAELLKMKKRLAGGGGAAIEGPQRGGRCGVQHSQVRDRK